MLFLIYESQKEEDVMGRLISFYYGFLAHAGLERKKRLFFCAAFVVPFGGSLATQ